MTKGLWAAGGGPTVLLLVLAVMMLGGRLVCNLDFDIAAALVWNTMSRGGGAGVLLVGVRIPPAVVVALNFQGGTTPATIPGGGAPLVPARVGMRISVSFAGEYRLSIKFSKSALGDDAMASVADSRSLGPPVLVLSYRN